MEDYDEQKKIKILFVLPSRSSFIQKDPELLRKHFDVRVRGFSFEHEKIKKHTPISLSIQKINFIWRKVRENGSTC